MPRHPIPFGESPPNDALAIFVKAVAKAHDVLMMFRAATSHDEADLMRDPLPKSGLLELQENRRWVKRYVVIDKRTLYDRDFLSPNYVLHTQIDTYACMDTITLLCTSV